MELPQNLKDLYRHWHLHLAENETSSDDEVFHDAELFREMGWFIHERINIWKKKTNGAAPPYTEDPTLAKYRFCNIFREFDRQTIEFHTFLNPLRDDFPLWLLNMFYYRMVARTSTVREVGLLSFNELENNAFLDRLTGSPRPRYGNAYVFPISTIQKSKTPTRELFLAHHLPNVIKSVAKEIETWNNLAVFDGVDKILPIFQFNHRFLWTEVLIDVAYQFPQLINLFGRFPVGPGAKPTFDRIDSKLKPSLLTERLSRVPIKTDLSFNNTQIRLSAENWEGIGCEFRKYTNLKMGKGRKRYYT